ncbi:MAG: type II toxin-antitoxin system RelE/ParE family toxin [Candidatus Sungbacteria bacterium]|nr:type II toxin-antitoxin system RelE/ParE family toxin [Candidatus Sungbacteria bacterium]
MAAKHFYSPQAEKDLNEIADYILADNLEAAVRFVDAVETTCTQLTKMPDMGRVFPCDNENLAELRMIRAAKSYSLYLIFYRKAGKRIEIIRILHGARDYPTIFNNLP